MSTNNHYMFKAALFLFLTFFALQVLNYFSYQNANIPISFMTIAVTGYGLTFIYALLGLKDLAEGKATK